MSLRTWLLLALAYVLVLAIVALEVPTALNLRDRVNAEVRSQAAGQADVVAASAADLLAPRDRASLDALARRAADSVRGRVIVVDGRGRVLSDSGRPGRRRRELRGSAGGRRRAAGQGRAAARGAAARCRPTCWPPRSRSCATGARTVRFG